MSEKHLTESAWKTFTSSNKIKDTSLQKALAKFNGCKEEDYEARLKGLKEIENCAVGLKVEYKANKAVAAYLDDVVKESDKSRKAIELLKKNADKKPDEDESEDSAVDLKGKLINALKKAKMRKPNDPPVEALVCKAGKACGVLMGKTVGAAQKKELLELLKDETGHKFIKGTCQWGEGEVYTFVLESLPSGAAKGLKAFLKEHTNVNYKVQVRDITGAVDEDLADTSGTGKQGSDAEAMESFKKRFEALLPEIKGTVSKGGPGAKEIKEKAGDASLLANKKEFAQANRLLDAIETLIGNKPTSPQTTTVEPGPVGSSVGSSNSTATPSSVPTLPRLEGEALENAKLSCLKSWASPEYAFQRKKGPEAFVRTVLAAFAKTNDRTPDGYYDDREVNMVIDHIKPYADPKTTAFDTVIQEFGAQGGNKEYVDHLLELVKKLPANKRPTVVRGPALTGANFDTSKNVITIDPSKVTDPTAILDFITFEFQNVLQREVLREATRKGGEAVAEIDYLSDQRYVQSLIQINKAQKIEELVVALGVPREFLVEVAFGGAMKAKKVDRPPKSTLPRQDMRQALWWWKTRRWTDDERKQVWMAENHGEGVGSSTELYEKQARAQK